MVNSGNSHRIQDLGSLLKNKAYSLCEEQRLYALFYILIMRDYGLWKV
ncbi:hypothetical protein CNEO2_350005 [Clostridium neonatale]|uniref:Uncharacterized protein n=1 Tax=Clostridium neonatale TaxID=137838 RepID=A0AAD1YIR6_9CLOT|nr:hypothetical protein CNEO_360034 [Clostridium neonatale]CAI3196358.1 hypothetical protein CNEO2_1420005 [Clostridium neonatale]CAI3203213.1 hypothetical protein CNEO2_330005 [Clostridium neonatale]CAI3204698.1 hypothetical protein CNEO2_320005 [Clostridium neonatale]CAI3236157.1 hypothetical protein CNEO2_250005 [Clostridium neonatale]